MKLVGENISIRFFEDSDAEALHNTNLRNKDFVQKYYPIRPEDFYTIEFQRQFIDKSLTLRENDKGYSFGIFTKETEDLIGNVDLFQIVRGSLQSCFIGYFLDKEYNGKGYMTEAVKLAVKYAFDELHLHRIEAGVMPHNIGSIRVLEKAGFHKEGIARKNVKINGAWEDHQVMAIISEND